jgi:hypothetical protein
MRSWSSLLWAIAGLGGLLAFFVVRGKGGGVALLVAGTAILVLGLGTALNIGGLGDQAHEEVIADQQRLHRWIPFWPEPQPERSRTGNIFQGSVWGLIGLAWALGGFAAVLGWWNW